MSPRNLGNCKLTPRSIWATANWLPRSRKIQHLHITFDQTKHNISLLRHWSSIKTTKVSNQSEAQTKQKEEKFIARGSEAQSKQQNSATNNKTKKFQKQNITKEFQAPDICSVWATFLPCFAISFYVLHFRSTKYGVCLIFSTWHQFCKIKGRQSEAQTKEQREGISGKERISFGMVNVKSLFFCLLCSWL